MPANMRAARKRMSDVREFFREHLAHAVDDPKEAMSELKAHFPDIPQHSWYNLRGEFVQMINEAKAGAIEPQGNGQLIEPAVAEEQNEEQVLDIPADLNDDAKRVVNNLLAQNQQLSNTVASQAAELALLRERLVTIGKRQGVLKKALGDLIDAL